VTRLEFQVFPAQIRASSRRLLQFVQSSLTDPWVIPGNSRGSFSDPPRLLGLGQKGTLLKLVYDQLNVPATSGWAGCDFGLFVYAIDVLPKPRRR
jgi:hypothetical protein